MPNNIAEKNRLSTDCLPWLNSKGPLFIPGAVSECNPSRSGVERDSVACLLLHKSPQPSLEKKFTLTTPPARVHLTPHLDSEVDRFLVDELTGEILSTISANPFDFTELLWIKGGENECKYWLQVYRSDLIVKKPSIQAITTDKGQRGSIFQFSKASQRRLLFVCRNSGHHIESQYCCTYHNSWPLNGRIVKNDLQRFIKRLVRRFGRDSLYFLWGLEFQDRGAPHIHFYSSIPPTRENHLFIAQMWLEVIGETENKECRDFNEHPKNFFAWAMKNGQYLAKEYISKSVQKEVPASFHSVGRFWGNSQNMKPQFSTIDPRDYEEALQEVYTQSVRIVTKCHERKIDHFKTFSRIFNEKLLRLFPTTQTEDIPGNIKKQISMSIKQSREHKTHRRQSPTNMRSRVQSYTLPGLASAFLDVANFLMTPARDGGFRRFSTWAAVQVVGPNGRSLVASTPPARSQSTPF